MNCPNCKKEAQDFDVDGRQIVFCKVCGWFEISADGEATPCLEQPQLLQPEPKLESDPVPEPEPDPVPEPEPQREPDPEPISEPESDVTIHFEDE